MAGWHHWLNGRESQWTLGVGDGQGGLVCCDSWGCKESDTTERLIWSDLIWLCCGGREQRTLIWNWGHWEEFLNGGNSYLSTVAEKISMANGRWDSGWCSKKKNQCELGTGFQECSSSAELLCPPHCVTHLLLNRCYPDTNSTVLSLTGPRGHLSRRVIFSFLIIFFSRNWQNSWIS